MRPEAGLRTLVVDDDPAVRSFVGIALSACGFECAEAADGAEALRVLAGEAPFNLIVLDLRMPVMDGETFYRSLRLTGDETPVLVLSAYADRRVPELAGEAALTKPFDVDELVSLATRLARGTGLPPGSDVGGSP
jgi:CheY-like chemotaxis protein